MKKLKQQIKAILKNECLTEVEKNHLKTLFKNFIDNRDLLARPTVDEDEDEEEYTIDSIIHSC